MNITNTTFIAQLPQPMQEEIYQACKEWGIREGVHDLEETLENIMCDRLCNVEDIIDITPYVGLEV